MSGKLHYTMEWVEVGRVKNDAINRNLSMARVRKIVAEYDATGIGIPELTERAEGLYSLDGAHRIAGTAIKLGSKHKLEMKVWHNATRADEARIMFRRNDFRRLSPVAFFLRKVWAGEPTQVAMAHIVQGLGLRIDESNADRTIRCVGALEKAYDHDGPQALKQALGLMREAWGAGSGTFLGPVIEGLSRVLGRWPDLSIDESLQALVKVRGGAAGLKSKGDAIKDVEMARLSDCIAQAFVLAYNVGKRQKSERLPSWFENTESA